MRINGTWHTCDDAELRPVVLGAMIAADGRWLSVPFWWTPAQTGRYFLQRHIGAWDSSAWTPLEIWAESVAWREPYALPRPFALCAKTAATRRFAVTFPASVEPEVLDMSVLGRDIMDMFAVIVDRRSDVVALLGTGHRYRMEVSGP